ncbi:MAG: lysophospholipid acyltransferase family protein [Pirellulales bacterium]|nr:lysophospholipid acyltransferase family protein [Pirellulales bacterium]
MSFKFVADYVVYLVVRLMICTVQSLPLGICLAISRRGGWLCWEVLRFRRQVVEENLRIAFPQESVARRNQIGLEMWRHLLLMMIEIAHAPRKITRTTWRHYASIPSMKEILVRLIDDRPLVIISGHLGNFEVGGFLLALHGFPTHTVARELDNRLLDKFVNKFRGASGQFMLSKHGSRDQIAAVLDSGGTLVLLGDQFAGQGGCWVDFFGRPASTHKAMALFTLASQAPTAVSSALRRAGPLTIEMDVPDIVDPGSNTFSLGSVRLLTEWYTAHLEKMVRGAPEQYWWVHRRWKGDPNGRRRRRPTKRELAA